MIHCNTQFGKLKTVIVGHEYNSSDRFADLTFNYFYQKNISPECLQKLKKFKKFTIFKDILAIRNQQLNELAKLLENLGVNVYRPHVNSKLQKIITPTFSTITSSPGNVRDLTLIYNDAIVETPIQIQSRTYENFQIQHILKHEYCISENCRWIRAPFSNLTNDSLDIDMWNKMRNFNINLEKYDIAIDAPQFMTIGKDVIVNISTYNHQLGYKWIKPFFPESNFFAIHCEDNHIDGDIMCLKPGVFLLNPHAKHIISQLPDKFKKWKFIIPTQGQMRNVDYLSDIGIRLASDDGMDINILSIDENTVIVNKNAISVIKLLETNHFTVIPFQLDYSEVFGGGIHCSTLDLERVDDYCHY